MPATSVEERTVLQALLKSVARHPDKPAVEDGTTSYTYGQLYSAARRVAGNLTRLGVQRQEAVLLMLDNHSDYVPGWLGLCFVLAIEVPVNTAYKGHLLAHLANDSGARLAILEEEYCERVAAIADQVPELRTVVVRGGTGAALPPGRFQVVPFETLLEGPEAEPLAALPGDLIGLLYTSGTTGPSRGAMIPYGHAWSCGAPEFFGSSESDDRIYITLPLFHVVGQWAGVFNAIISGATAVVRPRFRASAFWEEATAFGCTYTLMMGAMASFLFRQLERPDDAAGSIKKAMMLPVIPEIREFEKRFGVEVVTSYGMTEVSSPLVAPYGKAVPRGCGWVRPDFDAKVVDENDFEVARGHVGELLLRPKNPWSVMRGYHNDPAKTVAMWKNLWIHTGDLMYQDAKGQFFFVDRNKDAIRRRGENLSSYEVETAVNAHPAVLESAAVAVSSEASEDDLLVAVALKPGNSLEPEHLLRFLADELPYFMVPRYIRFVEALPKTPTERVRKVEIREWGTEGAWDREAAGFRIDRQGLKEKPSRA